MGLNSGLAGISIGMAALLAAVPAIAAGCPRGLICASDPQTVVKALQAMGYETNLGAADSTGDPLISGRSSSHM